MRLYKEAVQLGKTVGVEQSAPCLAGHQQHRQNTPATTAAELNLTIPFWII